ncbi:MAG: hypothetical protein UC662_09450, partial [Paraprevotella clara]|nr:hypothetical protein [Paraprevotella clara]
LKTIWNMKKKNLLVRVLVPLVLAGLVFVGFSACSQDDGYPEGFVLNDEKGAATLAKRSMPQGGESVTPPKPNPSTFSGTANVTFVPSDSSYGSFTLSVKFSYTVLEGEIISVDFISYEPTLWDFSINNIDLVDAGIPGHYYLVCSGSNTLGIPYSGSGEVLL